MKEKINNKIPADKAQQIVFIVYFVLFLLAAFICIYPVFWVFINSLKTTPEYYENPHGLPEIWHFELYMDVFKSFQVGGVGFWRMAWNSIWLAFGSQAINILASMCVAYPLARYNFPGKKFFYGIIIFRITIPIIGAGAAGYKLLRALGAINNPILYLITCFSGFDMSALIMYGYFKGVSREYSDAACLDGASILRTFVSVVFPIAWPCVLALYVNSVMGSWNNYMTPLLYLMKYPNLALGIYELDGSASFLGANGTAKYFGAVLLSCLVPLTLFGVSQKMMLENMSVGGLKG